MMNEMNLYWIGIGALLIIAFLVAYLAITVALQCNIYATSNSIYCCYIADLGWIYEIRQRQAK